MAAIHLSEVRRILVMKWSALGDVAIASTVIDDVRRAYPHATIVLNTLPSASRLFAADPRFDELMIIDVRDRANRLQRNLEWIRRVRSGLFDMVIDLQRSDHTRLLLTALLLTGHRIPHRIGNRGGFPYTVRPLMRDPRTHALAQMRSALEASGIPSHQSRPVLHASAQQREHAQSVVAGAGLAGVSFALFLPGSQAGGWLKRWGAERYGELAKLLIARGIVQRIAVAGGPEEVEECRRIIAAVAVSYPDRIEYLDCVPLAELPCVAEHAACIIANDTGTAHIAAAAGRPMLVVCGPTDPLRVLPVGDNVRAVQARLPCAGCYGKTCRVEPQPGAAPCMAAVTPEFVAAAVEGRPWDATGIRMVSARDAGIALEGRADQLRACAP